MKESQRKPYRIALIGDKHCGHELGLTPPRYWNDINRQWLEPAWKFYTEMLKQFGTVDALIDNGDGIDGPGYRDTTHHITTDIGKQVDMAVECIKQVKYKKLYIIKGTGFHTDGHTAYEDFIAKEMNTKALDELRLEIYGRFFHVCHVIGRSDTDKGQPTQHQKETINEILQAEFENYKAADVLLRAHVHYCFQVSTADPGRGLMRHVFTSPALQMRGP